VDDMKNIDFAKVMGWLGFVLRCPICNVKYNLQNIKVLESQQDELNNEARLLLHSECNKCKGTVMFNIDISGSDIVTAAAVTDLTSADSAKFCDYKPLSTNDCITIHQSIRKFDGDLVKALK
jgi:hypothetical protein